MAKATAHPDHRLISSEGLLLAQGVHSGGQARRLLHFRISSSGHQLGAEYQQGRRRLNEP